MATSAAGSRNCNPPTTFMKTSWRCKPRRNQLTHCQLYQILTNALHTNPQGLQMTWFGHLVWELQTCLLHKDLWYISHILIRNTTTITKIDFKTSCFWLESVFYLLNRNIKTYQQKSDESEHLGICAAARTRQKYIVHCKHSCSLLVFSRKTLTLKRLRGLGLAVDKNI